MKIKNKEELYKGKATEIKNKTYFETKMYTKPFFDKMEESTDDFIINVELPDQITKTINDPISVDDITFNRVWIQAVLPDDCYENHKEVVSMVYGLDVRKPVVKLYRGGLNMACTNLCVFNPSFLNVQELKPEQVIDFSPVDTIMQQKLDIARFLDKLKDTKIPYENSIINELLGGIIRRAIDYSYNKNYGKVKISPTTVLNAYKSIYVNEDSEYFIKEGEVTDMYNWYQALTQEITDSKDIMNKAEKTLLLKDLINI